MTDQALVSVLSEMRNDAAGVPEPFQWATAPLVSYLDKVLSIGPEASGPRVSSALRRVYEARFPLVSPALAEAYRLFERGPAPAGAAPAIALDLRNQFENLEAVGEAYGSDYAGNPSAVVVALVVYSKAWVYATIAEKWADRVGVENSPLTQELREEIRALVSALHQEYRVVSASPGASVCVN